MALAAAQEEYVDTIVRVARGDASILRVLREICGLEGDARRGALALVAAHLRIGGPEGVRGSAPEAPDSPQRSGRPGEAGGAPRPRNSFTAPVAQELFDCIEALRQDEIARRIAERLDAAG